MGKKNENNTTNQGQQDRLILSNFTENDLNDLEKTEGKGRKRPKIFATKEAAENFYLSWVDAHTDPDWWKIILDKDKDEIRRVTNIRGMITAGGICKTKKSDDPAADIIDRIILDTVTSLAMRYKSFRLISNKEIRTMKVTSKEVGNLFRMFESYQDERISAQSKYRNFLYVQILRGSSIDELGGESYAYTFIESFMREIEFRAMLESVISEIPVCAWMMTIPGIGATHAAALYSGFDIRKAKTAAAFWKYIGWDTGACGSMDDPHKRQKGKKLDYNPKLRSRCFLIGESFVKLKNNDKDVYGHLYQAKKEYYQRKNEAGGFSETAKHKLEQYTGSDKKIIERYKSGKLTDLHIDRMARRYAVKIFLAHLFEVWYELEWGKPAPTPYVLEYGDSQGRQHVHRIVCPNKDVVGLTETKKVESTYRSIYENTDSIIRDYDWVAK